MTPKKNKKLATRTSPHGRSGKSGSRSRTSGDGAGDRAEPGAGSDHETVAPAGAFPIVGVGASAGGLEAFTQLLTHLPLDTGMGFVLVQHLDPEHESALTQILARATRLPVVEIANGTPVEPDRVHVIPRDSTLRIEKGVLRLESRQRTRTPHRPIDIFFESLSRDVGDRAIGVVLSGTASDGTLGLEAIKAEGGITFAQDDSAKHDSMPRSAMAAGCVDMVLSPADIAHELARIARHPYAAGRSLDLSVTAGQDGADDDGLADLRGEEDRAAATAHEDDGSPLPSGGPPAAKRRARNAREKPATPSGRDERPGASHRRLTRGARRERGAEGGYKKILLLLHDHSGVDFSLYKSKTIQRRIGRRIILTRHDSVDDYAAFLRGNGKELDALYSDVLISVTSFFRNPEAFDAFKGEVLPSLLEKRTDEPVRCWVLGCSTGQEAYSIAMSFVEATDAAPRARPLQVFATDLNDALLDKARHGLYARSLVGEITPERLRRFFVEEDGGYRIIKSLRDMVVFARQNVIVDPPFSRMDIVSCRNVLIYLEPSLQKRVLPTFHYALRPGGVLLLGASESIGEFTDLFEPLDKKHKIYIRRPGPTPPLHLSVTRVPGDYGRIPARPVPGPETEAHAALRVELDAQREADRITISRFAVPGVLVSSDLRIVQFRGPTGPYLEPPTGKASFDVLKMVREGLMLPLRAAIERARKEQKPVRRENVRVVRDGQTRPVNLEVIPLKHVRERAYLILFEEGTKAGRTPAARKQPGPPRLGKKQREGRISELEADLTETREYFQSMQEQHEAANEELQAANEEVQSANEELQSLNEELETSKEELESANEELTTVNEEMNSRNAELGRLNNDLINLQTSTRLSVVVLGRDLTIRRFSREAQKQFDLFATDVGRPIREIRHSLVNVAPAAASRVGSAPLESRVDLSAIATEVITSLHEVEREVRDEASGWYSVRVRPYLTLEGQVDGAVMVLVAIDAQKRSEEVVAAARDYAENIVASVPQPLLVLDGELRVESANSTFYRVFRTSAVKTIGRSIYQLGNRQWDIPRLRELLEEILPRSTTIEDFEVEQHFEDIGSKTMLLDARRLVNPERTGERILLAIEDITERKAAQQAMTRLAALVTSSRDAIISKDTESVITSWNPGAERLFGYSAEEAIGRSVDLIIPEDHRDLEPAILERILRSESVENHETVRRRKDGGRIDVSLTVSPLKDAAGRVVGASAIARDITEQKRAEQALERWAHIFRRAGWPVAIIDGVDDSFRDVNPAFAALHGFAADELLGKPLSDVLAPESRAELADHIRTVDEVGDHVYEAIHVRRDGTRFPCLIHVTAFKGDGGRVVYRAATFQDLSERREAEEARRASEERFRMLADNMSQFAWTADAKGWIYWYNQRWYDYTGTTLDEVQGWGWKIVHHPDHVDRVVERIQRSWDSGVPWEDTFPLRGKDGAYRWFLSRARPIHDEQGNVVRWFGTHTDVTEQREMENRIRQQAEELAGESRRKDEFLAMLSHELRNPLAPIQSALHLLKAHEPAGNHPSSKQAHEVIQRQVASLTKLVNDLLEVSRVSSGRIHLNLSVVDMNEVIGNALQTAGPQFEERRHVVSIDLCSGPAWVSADPIRLEEVLINLFNNAAKFTPDGGRIEILCERPHEDNVVRVTVRDSGIGIDEKLLPHIYDLFSQADSSLARSAGGLGIGLSLVHRLVDLHGGTIQAHSPPVDRPGGRGTEFVVTLPLALAPDTPATAEQDSAPQLSPDGMRVLLVDDNVDMVTMLESALAEKGYSVKSAHDGHWGLQVAREWQPDVILLDIGLPGLDGYEIARRLRSDSKNFGRGGFPGKLIAVTGYGRDGDSDRAREAGFDAHLVKPYALAELEGLMRSPAR